MEGGHPPGGSASGPKGREGRHAQGGAREAGALALLPPRLGHLSRTRRATGQTEAPTSRVARPECAVHGPAGGGEEGTREAPEGSAWCQPRLPHRPRGQARVQPAGWEPSPDGPRPPRGHGCPRIG